MQLLDDHVLSMVRAGKIAKQDAIDRSQSPGEMQDKIEEMEAGRLRLPGDDEEDVSDTPQLRTS